MSFFSLRGPIPFQTTFQHQIPVLGRSKDKSKQKIKYKFYLSTVLLSVLHPSKQEA